MFLKDVHNSTSDTLISNMIYLAQNIKFAPIESYILIMHCS